jgi:hypothetical protein
MDGKVISNSSWHVRVSSSVWANHKNIKPGKVVPVTPDSRLTLNPWRLDSTHKTCISYTNYRRLVYCTVVNWMPHVITNILCFHCNSETSHLLSIIKYILKQTAVLLYGKWHCFHCTGSRIYSVMQVFNVWHLITHNALQCFMICRVLARHLCYLWLRIKWLLTVKHHRPKKEVKNHNNRPFRNSQRTPRSDINTQSLFVNKTASCEHVRGSAIHCEWGDCKICID